MKDKNSIEEEIIDKVDFELLKKEHEDILKSKSSSELPDNSDEIELISRNASMSLLQGNDYDTEEKTTKVTDPICSYEDDTEYFEPETDDTFDSGLIYTAGLVGASSMEEQTDSMAKDELLDEYTETVEIEKTKDSGRTIKMAYNLVSASIIIFLLLVTFLLVVYIQVLKAGNELASNGGSSVINGNPSIDQSYVQRIETENESLKRDIENLRSEIAGISSSSSAVVEPVSEGIQDEPIPLGAPTIYNDTSQSADDEQISAITEPAQTTKTYIVKNGDNLQDIAYRFYGDKMMYRKIMEANNLTKDIIQPNQKLIIP